MLEHCMERLRYRTKNLSQDSRYPEYNSGPCGKEDVAVRDDEHH
jgi:hypothetical protein